MKREIKFRVWDKKFRKMYSDGISVQADGAFYLERADHDGNGIEIAESEHGELAIMQFTGLLDKNGKEIYEGDILANSTPLPLNGRPIKDCLPFGPKKVVYEEAGFALRSGSKSTRYWLSSVVVRSNGLEVIGNIHENPELLK